MIRGHPLESDHKAKWKISGRIHESRFPCENQRMKHSANQFCGFWGNFEENLTKRKLEIIFIYIDHKEEMRTEVTFQNLLQSPKTSSPGSL